MIILLTLACAQASFGQPLDFQAILRSVGGPFTTRCDGTGDILNNHTLAFIYWDSNDNGPDPDDWIPDCLLIPGSMCIPEYVLAVNFYNFALEDNGSLNSPLFQGWFGSEYPGGPCDLYMRIFFGQDNDSCYTSPVFTLIQSEQTQEIVLYYSNWTCGPADVDPPPCHPSTFSIYLDMSDPMPQEECLLQTCPDGSTGLLVRASSGSYRPPVIQIESGCEIGCESANGFSFNPGLWQYLFIDWWLGEVVGEDVGCIRVRLIDHIPSAELDTFFVEAGTDAAQLYWQTAYETTLDKFEIWRPVPYGSEDHQVADILAENNPEGATYSYLDTAAFSHGGYIAYNLVMVDANGARYGAAYVEVHQVSVPDNSEPARPGQFALGQNYPNPFNPTTTIRYDVANTGHVTLTIFNLLGQKVARLLDGLQSAGSHTISWDAADLPSGLYLCRMEAKGFTQARKLMLLK